MKPQYMGRTSDLGEQVWVVATPHYQEDWEKERYGKSKSRSLEVLLGDWKNQAHARFYVPLLDAPLGQTMYAVVRRKKGLKPVAFIYFRNIKNESRGGRRELELISVTPPIRGQTEGINIETFHDHRDTECWVEIQYRRW